MCTIPSRELVSIDEIMNLVYRMVSLPVITSFKPPIKANFLKVNLGGVVDVRAYQELVAIGRILVVECNGGDPIIVKNVVDSLSHKNALDKPFISSIDVSFRDDKCPQILRDCGNFVESKNGWSKYHLHDLNGIKFWQHAINFKEIYGKPNNKLWEMTWYMNWWLGE